MSVFLQWIEANATALGILCSVIVGFCGAVAAVASMIKAIKTGKVSTAQYTELKDQIGVTQQGIVEAFKQVKFPTTWKVDLSKKIDAKFDELGNRLYNKLVHQDEAKTRLIIFMAKIMSNTAAYNKLTDDEKAELASLLTIVNELEIDA